jgi:hypothetical protein
MAPSTISHYTWLQFVSDLVEGLASLSDMSTVIVFFASIGGCGFPVVAKKVKWMKIPPKVFFFCKHFGTGVLIATAFVHVGSPQSISDTSLC